MAVELIGPSTSTQRNDLEHEVPGVVTTWPPGLGKYTPRLDGWSREVHTGDKGMHGELVSVLQPVNHSPVSGHRRSHAVMRTNLLQDLQKLHVIMASDAVPSSGSGD